MLAELLLLVVACSWLYVRWSRGYWHRRGVYTPPNSDFIFGHVRPLLFRRLDLPTFLDQIYREHKDKKLIGIYNFLEPFLIVTDLDLMKNVLSADFNSFADQLLRPSRTIDPLLAINPFASNGELWKTRRGLHTATQTSSKLKEYFPTMVKNVNIMINQLKENISQPMKVAEVTRYYTIDNVTSIAYGYEPTAFTNPENGFRKFASLNMVNQNFDSTSAFFLPKLAQLTNNRFVTKETSDFFMDMSPKLLEFRKQSTVARNDFMDHLIKYEERKKAAGNKGLSVEEIAGHMFTTYGDSVETSSGLLSFILLELARRPEAQERLRDEIRSAGTALQDYDMEKIAALPYLGWLFNEILRLHPLLPFFSRICTRATKLGDKHIEPGVKVLIPYGSFITDPDIFPEPEMLRPERFSPQQFGTAQKKAFLPFGDGPRQCLGMRYGTVQIKLAVIGLLLNFRLVSSNKDREIQKDFTFIQRVSPNEQIILQSL